MTVLDRALSASSSLISSEIAEGNAFQREGDTAPQGYVWEKDQRDVEVTHWCCDEAEMLHLNYVRCQVHQVWVSRNNDIATLKASLIQ